MFVIKSHDLSNCRDCITAMRRRIRGMLMSGKHYSLDSRMDLVQTVVSSKDNEDDGKENHLPPMRESSVEGANCYDDPNYLQTLDTGITNFGFGWIEKYSTSYYLASCVSSISLNSIETLSCFRPTSACQTELNLLFNGGITRHRSHSVDGKMDDLASDTGGRIGKGDDVISSHNSDGRKSAGFMVRQLERGTSKLRSQDSVCCQNCGTQIAANR